MGRKSIEVEVKFVKFGGKRQSGNQDEQFSKRDSGRREPTWKGDRRAVLRLERELADA